MSDMVIWLVEGTCGEYSDHSYWLVRGFWDEAEAQACADRLNAWCRANGVDKDNAKYYDLEDKPAEDPQFQSDYTGTSYTLRTIEVVGNTPDAQTVASEDK